MYVSWTDNMPGAIAARGPAKIVDAFGEEVVGVEAVACDLETGLIEAVQLAGGAPVVADDRITTYAVFRPAPLTLAYATGEILTSGGSPPESVIGTRRSPHWPEARAAHLKENPTCAACGGRQALQVHHKLPYHLFPGEELNPANLVTLCATVGRSCHFLLGHLLDWRSYNVNVVVHARLLRQAIADRPPPSPGKPEDFTAHPFPFPV